MRGTGLSKSRFISGTQCHLRLWYETYRPDLRSEPDDVLQAVFDTGHEVGRTACRLYPGGHDVNHDHRHIPEALEETRSVIDAGSAPALFEAAFEHQGVLVRADVIERLPGGGWRLVEVKSSTRLKDVFVRDAAVQLWVLKGAGLDVRDAGVLTLDRDYVHDGVTLDLDALFRLHPVLEEASAYHDAVEAEVREMQRMLSRQAAPDIAPGGHCFEPYECPYYAHCTRDAVWPDHSIDELPRLDAERRTELAAAGIEEIREVPGDFPLTWLQGIVRQTICEGRATLHGDISGALANLRPPVRHLDFETFAPAIPRFAGTRPFDAVPFLFSVHTENRGKGILHADYLHESNDDPRPELADRLIEALGREGSVCTYSGYEGWVLRQLCEALPDRAGDIRAIEARLFDLLPVVRNGYYHPEFRGSFSIKNVLPVLAAGLSYDDLAISDGRTAAVLYAEALANADQEGRRRTFEDLRAYCARDTLALVTLREALGNLARETGQ
ncbi:MAG: DUF2779 domain-containing protein [bacterium]|nr:DUF2779 domain-containing protein [bacterium]